MSEIDERRTENEKIADDFVERYLKDSPIKSVIQRELRGHLAAVRKRAYQDCAILARRGAGSKGPLTVQSALESLANFLENLAR